MRKEVVLGTLILLVLFLSTVSTVSATDTKIKVTTYADHELNLNFLQPPPDFIQLYESFNLESGSDGEIEFVFSHAKQKFDITAFVMKDGQKVLYERFDGNIAGESIHLILFNGNVQKLTNYEELEATENDTEDNETVVNDTIVNDTVENVTVEESGTTEEDADQGAAITGLATSEEESEGGIFSNNALYFIFGFLVLVSVIFTGVMKMKKKKKDDGEGGDVKEIKVKKLSEKIKELKEDKGKKGQDLDDYKKAIDDAEKKIEEAQKEIKKLKNADKIGRIKQRMIEDQKELMKLRGDKDD